MLARLTDHVLNERKLDSLPEGLYCEVLACGDRLVTVNRLFYSLPVYLLCRVDTPLPTQYTVPVYLLCRVDTPLPTQYSLPVYLLCRVDTPLPTQYTVPVYLLCRVDTPLPTQYSLPVYLLCRVDAPLHTQYSLPVYLLCRVDAPLHTELYCVGGLLGAHDNVNLFFFLIFFNPVDLTNMSMALGSCSTWPPSTVPLLLKHGGSWLAGVIVLVGRTWRLSAPLEQLSCCNTNRKRWTRSWVLCM